MSETPYNKELRKIFSDKSPAPPTTLSRPEIEAQITAISEALKGPMPNWERLDAVEARTILRKQLADMDSI